jgi:hypothetical protein
MTDRTFQIHHPDGDIERFEIALPVTKSDARIPAIWSCPATMSPASTRKETIDMNQARSSVINSNAAWIPFDDPPICSFKNDRSDAARGFVSF